MTSLDSATRLLRYNVSEIGDTLRVDALSNRYVASGIAVVAIWAFAFIQVDGEFAGLIPVATVRHHQSAPGRPGPAGVTLYLLRRGKPLVYTAAPMVFMLLSTLTVMSANLTGFWSAGQWLLLAPAATIFTLAVWLVVEAALAVIRFRRNPVLNGLEVVVSESSETDSEGCVETDLDLPLGATWYRLDHVAGLDLGPVADAEAKCRVEPVAVEALYRPASPDFELPVYDDFVCTAPGKWTRFQSLVHSARHRRTGRSETVSGSPGRRPNAVRTGSGGAEKRPVPKTGEPRLLIDASLCAGSSLSAELAARDVRPTTG